LLWALRITVFATACGMSLALIIGLVLAILRRSPFRMVSTPAAVFIEFVRSTPLLVQIYFLFYVAPKFGLGLSPLWTGILALGFHYGAYTSEVYRAGIDSVPKGQWEASVALNLSPVRRFVGVILPQAIPPIIPALANYVIAMFKETPLLSTITVLEMLYVAKDIGSQTFRYLEPLTIVGILFLVVSLAASIPIRFLERRFRPASA
jgi:polar amino acid transport system permease protein